MITRDFSVISNDVTGVSLSLSLSLPLTKVIHAQYRKRFRASYNSVPTMRKSPPFIWACLLPMGFGGPQNAHLAYWCSNHKTILFAIVDAVNRPHRRYKAVLFVEYVFRQFFLWFGFGKLVVTRSLANAFIYDTEAVDCVSPRWADSPRYCTDSACTVLVCAVWTWRNPRCAGSPSIRFPESLSVLVG